MKKHRITIELGQAKNPNKNPLAEREVQELETELLRQEPWAGVVSPLTLAITTIIARNVDTAGPVFKRAITPRRRPFSCPPAANHPYSELSKAPLRLQRPTPFIDVGDLVYLDFDRNKC